MTWLKYGVVSLEFQCEIGHVGRTSTTVTTQENVKKIHDVVQVVEDIYRCDYCRIVCVVVSTGPE